MNTNEIIIKITSYLLKIFENNNQIIIYLRYKIEEPL